MKAILKINYPRDAVYIDFGYDGVSDTDLHYWPPQRNPDVGLYFLTTPNEKRIKKLGYE